MRSLVPSLTVVAFLFLVVPVLVKGSDYLTVAGIKVGANGIPDRVDAKVIQILGPEEMLVGLEDARYGRGRYDTVVVIRKVSTTGITDGAFWRSWTRLLGKGGRLVVTGTTTYRTVLGATRTVFVLEPESSEVRRVREKKEKEVAATLAEQKAAVVKKLLDKRRVEGRVASSLIDVKKWNKGDWGYCRQVVTVFRVVDNEVVLGTVGHGPLLQLRVRSTEGWKVGARVPLNSISFTVVGQKDRLILAERIYR